MSIVLSVLIAAGSQRAAIIPDSVSHHVATFGELLTQALMASGLSQRKFAELVGAVNPHVNLIISGKRTPPLHKVAAWADALHLTKEQRAAFTEAAHLAHSTDVIRALVGQLRVEAMNDRRELDEVRAQFAALTAHLRTKGYKLPKGLGDV